MFEYVEAGSEQNQKKWNCSLRIGMECASGWSLGLFLVEYYYVIVIVDFDFDFDLTCSY